eukprot:gene17358-20795_t
MGLILNTVDSGLPGRRQLTGRPLHSSLLLGLAARAVTEQRLTKFPTWPAAVTTFSAAQRSRVTMLDVAERAGVSKASVSRFIGDDRALLSDAIALRIEQAIDELGYRPNQMARGLKRGRTRLIGMLVADIRNPYSIAVMHGVETACRQHGYSLVVCNTDRDDEQERQHLAALRAYNIEGLI